MHFGRTTGSSGKNRHENSARQVRQELIAKKKVCMYELDGSRIEQHRGLQGTKTWWSTKLVYKQKKWKSQFD